VIIESKGKIADGLFAVGAPELPAYLLMGKTPVLFDAGMTFMGPLYLKDLKTLLEDENRLRFIFLTHAHFDHSGACPYLKRHIEGLQVGAHPLAAQTFIKPNAVALIRSLSKDYEDRHAAQTGKEDIFFDALQVDILLEDGMDFDPGGGLGFKVVATPGHTRDSISFYIQKLKALITGEAVGVYDRNMTIHPEYLASYDDYLASLEKLARLDLDILMMSHYFMLTGQDAKGYIVKSIERTKIFKTRIENCLHELHGDREAVVKRIFKEDFEDTGAILQDARPFLINLAAKVRAVAERK
jgi:glyoxylase-like metal-dependent hydrolase (beta-lactamase superfamily II)